MHPRSIAWVGASNNPAKMGTIQLNNLLGGGFEGTVYPIHPTEKTVLGLEAYPNASSLPEAPDMAFVVVPTRVAVEILDDLGRRGVKRAVIVTGGLKDCCAARKRAWQRRSNRRNRSCTKKSPWSAGNATRSRS